MATVHVYPHVTKSGRVHAKATYYRPGMSPDEAWKHIVEKTEFHYRCGRKVYDRNQWAINAQKLGCVQIIND